MAGHLIKNKPPPLRKKYSLQLWIRTYSSAEATGMVPLCYDQTSDQWSLGSPFTNLENCSYGAVGRQNRLCYFVDETADTLSVCRYSEGDWEIIQTVSSEGQGPCFVSLADQGNIIAIANYQSGSVVTYAVNGSGLLADNFKRFRHRGHGPNKQRQAGPHAHCAVFFQDRLYSVDLGADLIVAHPVGIGSSGLKSFVAFQAPAGEGPRHLVFHPLGGTAYLFTELGSKIFVLRIQNDGTLIEQACLSTLPAGFRGESLGGHIALDSSGERLYATNRGHNSVATFAVAPNGNLSLLGHAPTAGASPRYFLLLEHLNRIVMANEEGNSVSILGLNEVGAVETLHACLTVSKPAFLALCI